MNILIVEDSRFLRLAGERALTKAGHKVTSASDGEEGLRIVRQILPDLIVLDMMLPKLSGQEILQALRADPQTAAVPVMVLTSLPQCNAEKLKGEGATGYYQKSLLEVSKDSNRFVDAVDIMLRKTLQARAAAKR